MRKSCVFLILALSLCLTGCGGSAKSSGSSGYAVSSPSSAPSYDTAMRDEYDNGWSNSEAAEAAPDFSAVRANAKLILSASMTLETQDFDAACTDLERMTAEAGGYIESSGTYGTSGSRSADYILRVPQQRFEESLRRIGESCHVISSRRWSEDVTEQYTDIETRLSTLRTKHERLLSLLDKAELMEDIISLENALADTEYELDSLTGRLRQYDNLVGFSTINVSIEERLIMTVVQEGTGFGSELAQAFRSGFYGLTSFLRDLILLVAELWPLILFLCAAVPLIRRLLRRRRERRAQEPKAKPRRFGRKAKEDVPPMTPPSPIQREDTSDPERTEK